MAAKRCDQVHIAALKYRLCVPLKIPGQAGIVEAKKARLAAAVQWQWNVVTATPQAKPRRPSAGDLGKRLQTARLA
jgi:hypothetical protein